MMDQSIVVALIVAVVAPAVMALITGHQRRKEKREDWARQDAVAARVEKVAVQQNIADKRQIVTAEAVDVKLAEIKELVDGGLTRQMRESLAGIERELAFLADKEPSTARGQAIAAAQKRQAELTNEINRRSAIEAKGRAEAVARTKAAAADNPPIRGEPS